MRSTTIVHAAFRNIGDAQDTGQHFCGTVKETVIWLATNLATISLASRVVIGIGRNHEQAMMGIQVPGAGRKILPNDIGSMMDSIFDDSEEIDDSPKPQKILTKVEGDDYEG